MIDRAEIARLVSDMRHANAALVLLGDGPMTVADALRLPGVTAIAAIMPGLVELIIAAGQGDDEAARRLAVIATSGDEAPGVH